MSALLITENSVNSEPPKDVNRYPFAHLTDGTKLENAYIRGAIVEKYGIYLRPYPCVKLVLEDSSGLMDVYSVGQLAKKLHNMCKLRDTLLCMKFGIEKCPGHMGKPFQIVIDDKDTGGSLVWVISEDRRKNLSKFRVDTVATEQPNSSMNRDIKIRQENLREEADIRLALQALHDMRSLNFSEQSMSPDVSEMGLGDKSIGPQHLTEGVQEGESTNSSLKRPNKALFPQHVQRECIPLKVRKRRKKEGQDTNSCSSSNAKRCERRREISPNTNGVSSHDLVANGSCKNTKKKSSNDLVANDSGKVKKMKPGIKQQNEKEVEHLIDTEDSDSSESFEVLTSLEAKQNLQSDAVGNESLQVETITSSQEIRAKHGTDQSVEKNDDQHSEHSMDSFVTACTIQSVPQAQQMESLTFSDTQSELLSPKPKQSSEQQCHKENENEFIDMESPPNQSFGMDAVSYEDVCEVEPEILCFDSEAVIPETEDLSPILFKSSSTNTPTNVHENSCLQLNASSCHQPKVAEIIGHQSVQFTTLCDVLKHEVPYKFKIRVRVQDFSPKPTEARDLFQLFCSLCGHMVPPTHVEQEENDALYVGNCPNCTDRPCRLTPAILLGFCLTDGQNSLVALLWEMHAIRFLNNIDPFDLLTNESKFEEIKEMLSTLCPLHLPVDKRPEIECCVFSYKVGKNVKYQIFDTRLTTERN